MASSAAIDAVVNAMISAGIPEREARSARNNIGEALDAGFSGPAIVALATQYDAIPNSNIGGALSNAARQRRKSQEEAAAAEREAAEEARGRVEAGFDTVPVDPFSLGPYNPLTAGGSSEEDGLDAVTDRDELLFQEWAESRGYTYDGRHADGRFLATGASGPVFFEKTPMGAFVISGNQDFDPTAGSPRAGFAPQSVELIKGKGGELFVFNPNTQSIDSIGVYPELADDPTLDFQIDRNGDLVSIDPTGNLTVVQKGFAYPSADPNVTTITNKRTGETIRINQVTGETTPLGTFDWAQIDPERSFQEAIRQFDIASAQADRELGIAERGQGLAEFDSLRSVLNEPVDYITSAYLRRGVESPLTTITQADLVNGLLASVRAASGGQTAQDRFDESVGTSLYDQSRGQNPAAGTTGRQAVPERPRVDTTTGPLVTSALPTQEQLNAKIRELNTAVNAGTTDAGRAMADFERYKNTPLIAATSSAVSAPVAEKTPPVPGARELAPSVFDNITQEDIIATAKQYAPPGVSALLGGTTEQLSPLQFPEGIKVATPRQMNRLTQTEVQALPTRLAAENVNISDYLDAQKQMFGQPRTERRGRLLV